MMLATTKVEDFDRLKICLVPRAERDQPGPRVTIASAI